MDLILTTSNLRGINFKVDFSGDGAANQIITNHGGFFRYKVTNAIYSPGVPSDGTSLYYVLDLKNSRDVFHLKNATLSTGAFPIGLKSREVEISNEYIKRYPAYLFNRMQGITALLDDQPTYKFNSIDGGLINNEPYGIGFKVLREKNPEHLEDVSYAIIMVDPFPNRDPKVAAFNPKQDIVTVAKGMFKALRNQVMFNQDGILDALALDDRTKFLIAPSRKETIDGKLVRAVNHLASAPISGFGGFLDKSFREHDFELGRMNCRTFLKYYFAIETGHTEKRFGIKPHAEALNRFQFTAPPNAPNKKNYFPIIPDVRFKSADEKLVFPPYPTYSMEHFEAKYKDLIKKRLKTLVQRISGNLFLSTAFNLFYQNKAYTFIKSMVVEELRDAGLIK